MPPEGPATAEPEHAHPAAAIGQSSVAPALTARRRAASVELGVRSAVTLGLLGLVTFIPFYLWDYDLQSKGRSAESIEMSYMHMTNMSVYWSIPVIMATGIAAMIWAYLSVALGLFDSGRTISWVPLSRAQIDRLHRQISLLVLALIVVHAFTTAFDSMGDNLLTVFVPFTQTWKQAAFAYQLGIFALYLAILLGPTYYLRRLIGPARWRLLHRASVVIYILAFWHAMILGSELAYYGWVRPFMWLAQIPLLVLCIHRLRQPATSPRRLSARSRMLGRAVRRSLVVASGAGVVAAVAIVATGNAGFIAHV